MEEIRIYHQYKLSVVCEEGFWRKGNVDIVCHRYNIDQFENLDVAMDEL